MPTAASTKPKNTPIATDAPSPSATERKACARATPIDTAVAATISEMTSAKVAISSTAARRRLANRCSEIGEVKPTSPVRRLIVGILRESKSALSHYRRGCRRAFDESLAKLLTKKGKFVVLVNGWLTP